MDVQELERNAGIRFKFASFNKKNGYDGDADEEYASIFPEQEGDLTEGWVYKKVDKRIVTRFEGTRRAWILSHTPTQTEIAAVEHETGIEILILTGIASGVGTAAIVGLVKWGWKKWNSLRENKPNKVESGLIRDKVTDRFPDGRIRTVERMELRAPLNPQVINQVIQESFSN